VIDGHIGLRAGVWLHVGVLRAEERPGAIAGQVLGDVDDLAAAVVAPSGIPPAYLAVRMLPIACSTAKLG
jgi:hypothetical protein